jgi:hypothetical protein
MNFVSLQRVAVVNSAFCGKQHAGLICLDIYIAHYAKEKSKPGGRSGQILASLVSMSSLIEGEWVWSIWHCAVLSCVVWCCSKDALIKQWTVTFEWQGNSDREFAI